MTIEERGAARAEELFGPRPDNWAEILEAEIDRHDEAPDVMIRWLAYDVLAGPHAHIGEFGDDAHERVEKLLNSVPETRIYLKMVQELRESPPPGKTVEDMHRECLVAVLGEDIQ